MPAADLDQAIADLLLADAGLAASFGHADWFWIGEAGRGTALPRAVWTDVAGAIEGEASPDNVPTWVGRAVKQLTVLAASRAQARALARAVARAVERADAVGSITYSEAGLIHLRRAGGGIGTLDPEKGPDGADVWQHVLQLEAFSDDSDQ